MLSFSFGGAGAAAASGASTDLKTQLDTVCRAHNADYSAKLVSWNDNARQMGSAFGPNITDARLKGKDGENFLVVRPQNFNEKIGRVSARDVAVLAGNERAGHADADLRVVGLDQWLAQAGQHASYAGLPSGTSLSSPTLDDKVGIRFQVVFLPTPAQPSAGDGALEFFPDTYNYQTRSRSDPKNLVLLSTTQGTFTQQDGPGSQPQYLHKWDAAANAWRKTFLEAKRTRHGVSMEQVESREEVEDALRQGKAISKLLGIFSMGRGFNRLMTIQVPLKQHQQNDFRGGGGGGWGAPAAPCFQGLSFSGSSAPTVAAAPSAAAFSNDRGGQPRSMRRMFARAACAAPPAPTRAKAARVSYGSDAGSIDRISLREPIQRDPSQAITITVQFYFVVEQGKQIEPSDIRDAVDLCEKCLDGCRWNGRLMDGEAWWMRQDLTAADAAQIQAKIAQQPPHAQQQPSPQPLPPRNRMFNVVRTSVHPHELYLCSSSDVSEFWFCDGQNLPGACKSRSTGSVSSEFERERWRCGQCDYDLCRACKRAHLSSHVA